MVKPYFEFEKLVAAKGKNQVMHESFCGNIKLENVSFKYFGTNEYALKNINFFIKEGQKIAIVGKNGFGKTTLLKMLLNLLKPTEGQIYYENKAGRWVKDCSVPDNVSIVPQEYNCYSVTIKENIVFGDEVSDLYIKKLLDSVDLGVLQIDPAAIYGREFDGIELSGGQKQRIAILRAKNKSGDVVAFDEPTSAIDPFQEKMIYDKLEEIANGKTTFIVSHRLALTKNADLIMVLNRGEIIEMGTHDELLRKRGEYFRMWNAQVEVYEIG